MATVLQDVAARADSATTSQAAGPVFQITGTYRGLTAPAINGVAVLRDDQIHCFAPATGAPVPVRLPKFAVPATGLCGDMTNGIAVCAGSDIAYTANVGIAGAGWHMLPQCPPNPSDASGKKAIQALSGDLVNGLVAADGTRLCILMFNDAPLEWQVLPALPPGAMTAIAGDPTNGILLAMTPGQGQSSSLFTWAPAWPDGWVALTAPHTALPRAMITVGLATGNGIDGFVVFGENQFYIYQVTFNGATATAGPTAIATIDKPRVQPPFAISALSGDAGKGCTAVAAASGLIATCDAGFATWTVVNVMAPEGTGPA